MKIDLSEATLTPFIAPSPKEMLSIREEAGCTYVRINSSSLSIMQECWRKAEYSLIRGLKSNIESPATLFGTAIHKGLEVFYSGSRQERVIPKSYEGVLSMIGCGNWQPEWADTLVYRAAKAFVDKAEPLKALPEGNKRSISTGIWMLQHYFQVYINDPFVVVSNEQGPIVEYKFNMPVYSSSTLVIEAFGQIDVVLKNEATGIILGCDHKTTSILGTQFYDRLNPNFQYDFYTWAINDALKLSTESFMVNALQVKEPPKTSRGSPPQFARQVTTRTRDSFEELRRTIIRIVRIYLQNLDEGFFPKTAPGPCSNYGGCQFLQICSSPEQLKEAVIAAKYKELPYGKSS